MMFENFPKVSYEGLKKRIADTQKEMIKEVKEMVKEVGEENYKQYFETKSFKKKMNKVKKAEYLLKNYSSFEKWDSEHLVNFFRNQDNYDSWNDFYVFDTLDMEIVENELEKMYVEIEGSSWSSDYDCTGRAFFRPCYFYKCGNRIYVTQSGGLDV